MAIAANLVIGVDGSTSFNGKSAKLSSVEDRRRFHEIRKGADVIIIGGNTARVEPYSDTPIPLVVVSKSKSINEISNNSKAEILNMDPKAALKESVTKYGKNVLIEGGPNLLMELLPLIEELNITITDRSGDGQIMSFDGLTRDFIMESMDKVQGEIFYKFKRQM
mgnify:FL=1